MENRCNKINDSNSDPKLRFPFENSGGKTWSSTKNKMYQVPKLYIVKKLTINNAKVLEKCSKIYKNIIVTSSKGPKISYHSET